MAAKSRHNLTLNSENLKKLQKILEYQGMSLSSYVDAVIEEALRRYRKNHLPLAPAKMDLEHLQKTINRAVKLMGKANK